MRFCFFLFSVFLWGFHGFSQDVKITDIENHSFPTIKVSVELNEAIDINTLKIRENGKFIDLKIDSVNKGKSKKAVFLLFDINRFKQTEIKTIWEVLSSATTSPKPGLLLNIGYPSGIDSKNCFIPLSFEFSENQTAFVKFASKLAALNTKNDKSVDINCALRKVVDFMVNKKNLPDEKIIVVLTKNTQNIARIKQMLETDGDKHQISVKVVSNVLDSSIVKPADFYSIGKNFTKQKLQEKLIQAVQNNKLTNLQKKVNYTLVFTGTQNERLNYFELLYLNQKVEASYIKPRSKPYKILWFVIVLLILLVILAFFIRKHIRMKKQLAGLKETVSLLFDKRVKILGKQTLNPVIEVRLADKITNYHIKKLSTTLGRGKDCDLKIEDLTISSHHASITNEGGEFYIKDNESTNGVFVNDLKIDKGIIKNGDIIRLGKAVLMIHY